MYRIAKLLFCFLCFACPAGAVDNVIIYTSANSPPLMLENGRGIYPALVDYLNQQDTGILFRLVFLPRKRLQIKADDGSLDGIVIGMMPQWFDDVAQRKYLWTEPFSFDRFVLVTKTSSSMSPEDAASLRAKSVGMVLGYGYPGIGNWMEHHRMVRNDSPSEEIALEKLLVGRVDSVVVGESIARYYIRINKLAGQLRIMPAPGNGTERRFLVPLAQRKVFMKLAPVVRKLRDDPEWQKRLASFE